MITERPDHLGLPLFCVQVLSETSAFEDECFSAKGALEVLWAVGARFPCHSELDDSPSKPDFLRSKVL